MRGDSNLSDSDFFKSQNMYRQKAKKIYNFDKTFKLKKTESKKNFFTKFINFIRGK